MWWTRNPSIFWGGVLVLLGVLFLLGNTGVLNNLSWDVIWPVLLIAVGVWLLLGRLGPGRGMAFTTTGAMVANDVSEPREGLSHARLEIAVGSAEIAVRTAPLGDQLYRAHLEHSGTTPEIKLDRSTGTLRISHRFDWFPGIRRLSVDAQLADEIPWDISCTTGEIHGAFDLSSGRLGGFTGRTGASRIDLNLPRPAGVVPVHIDGGALTLHITRPAGTAIRVHASAGAVQIRADGSRLDGVGSREWRSNGFDAATDRYEVTVTGGATNVTVEER